jgi:hypothetical protein
MQQEYMNYMSKKTNLRQTTIITLSDQNKKELDDIKIKKENMLRDFETRKTSKKLRNNSAFPFQSTKKTIKSYRLTKYTSGKAKLVESTQSRAGQYG